MLADDRSPGTGHPRHSAHEASVRAAVRAPLLEATALVRRFGGRAAVDEVRLTLRSGECLALFGPNGAGKTTLLRMLGGLLKPSSGTVSLDGHTLPGEGATRRLIGLISHHTMLYGALTARENIRFAAECQGVLDVEGETTRVLSHLRLPDRADTLVRALSRGLQQRVSIARALVHRPRLVLLDEPYTGLDEVGASALTQALRDALHDGAAVVLITHHLHEGLALATHTAIMLNGRFAHTEQAGANGIDVTAYQRQYRSLVSEGAE